MTLTLPRFFFTLLKSDVDSTCGLIVPEYRSASVTEPASPAGGSAQNLRRRLQANIVFGGAGGGGGDGIGGVAEANVGAAAVVAAVAADRRSAKDVI